MTETAADDDRPRSTPWRPRRRLRGAEGGARRRGGARGRRGRGRRLGATRRSRSSARAGPSSATTRRTPRCCSHPALGVPPRELAERLGGALQARLGASLERFEVAGPGFLNLFLSDSWLTAALAHALDAGERFGAGGARGARAHPDRVRLGQSDRADARRPCAQRRLRRRARAHARAARPRRGARVLRQRRGLAGAQAGRVDPGARARRGGARGRLPGRLRDRAGSRSCRTPRAWTRPSSVARRWRS